MDCRFPWERQQNININILKADYIIESNKHMAEVNNTTTTETKKPEFKSEIKFQFQGRNKSVAASTAMVERGKHANKLVYVRLPELTFDALSDLWDPELLMDEVFNPELNKLALKASKIATKAATTTNPDGSESFDDARFQEEWTKIISKLSTALESRRALNQKIKDLLKKLGDLSVKAGTPEGMQEFQQCAVELAEAQRQRAALDEVDEEDEATPENTEAAPANA
jgi:hypothetical protein